MSFPLVIALSPERLAYKGKAYFGADEYGHGVNTLDEAEAALAKFAAGYHGLTLPEALRAQLYTGRFIARVRRPCRECGVTGVKAGCKRKRCPACAGVGTTDVVDFIVGGGK